MREAEPEPTLKVAAFRSGRYLAALRNGSPVMEPLKLACFDADDLAVVSAHLQDAVVRVGDILYMPERTRFGLVSRRFDWEAGEPRRRLTGLYFDHVKHARTRGIDRGRPEDVLSLLAVTFAPADAPSGMATLVFAGGASIQLDVECVEACMNDLGPVWAAPRRPAHDLERA